MERRVRILLALAVVNGLLAIGALGLIAWMNADPVYWFPKLASAQGPQGEDGERGARGQQGPPGPVGVSGDVEVDDRISELENTVGSSTSSDDFGTLLDDHSDRIDTLETDVVDLQDRLDTAETSLSNACDALDYAGDPNLNGAC